MFELPKLILRTAIFILSAGLVVKGQMGEGGIVEKSIKSVAKRS
jgi:hypothetical protein